MIFGGFSSKLGGWEANLPFSVLVRGSGSGFRVSGSGFRVSGFGYQEGRVGLGREGGAVDRHDQVVHGEVGLRRVRRLVPEFGYLQIGIHINLPRKPYNNAKR